MTCPKCGKTLDDGSKYCSSCGEALFRRCCKCGNPIQLGEQFCSQCGSDNSEEALAIKEKNKIKKKKTVKLILIPILALLLVFIVLQGISIIKTLNYLKNPEPTPVICNIPSYLVFEDAQDYYAPAWLFATVEKGYYKIYLINMIQKYSISNYRIEDMISDAVKTGSSQLIKYPYFKPYNSYFLDPDDIIIANYDWPIYEEKVKWIWFGWFWEPDNTRVILSSGKQVYPYGYYGKVPFTFDGSINLNGTEVKYDI